LEFLEIKGHFYVTKKWGKVLPSFGMVGQMEKLPIFWTSGRPYKNIKKGGPKSSLLYQH